MLSLLKAVLTEDMNLFNVKTKSKSKVFKKYLFPIILFLLVGFSIGTYAYEMAKTLHPVNLTFVMLSLFILIVTIFTFIEGIYKSQGMLFECKDNDLLFSMPISKSKILFVRIFKLILFQIIYNMMFLLPAIIVYIYFEHPSISFYFLSILMVLLIPIIPTIISCAIGYLIKLLSNHSKNHKIAQALITVVVFMIVFMLGFNYQSFLENIASNANSINDLLIKIYYPIGLYVNLITSYNLIDLFKLLFINLVPFIIFILLFSKYYYNMIFIKKINKDTKNNKPIKFNVNTLRKSLIIKELKRYLYSPVYMFNSSFGLFLLLIISVMLCIKGNTLLSSYDLQGLDMSILYYFILMFTILSTSITSSSISLEGKTINTTKSLPIRYKDIFISKILYPSIIEAPFILVSLLLFIIVFKPSILYIVFLILISIITFFFTSIAGLLINIKYPKLNFTNDTEVVKQSMSSFLSVFLGFGMFILSIIICVFLSDYLSIKLILLTHILFMTILTYTLYLLLMKIGPKEYKKLYV